MTAQLGNVYFNLYSYWLKGRKKEFIFHCAVLRLCARMPKGKHLTLKINYFVYLKIYSDLYSFSKKFQPVEKLEILGALLLVYAYTRELNQALVVLYQARRNHGFRLRGIMYLFPDFGVIQKFRFWFANICRCDLLYRINLDQFFFHCSSSR